ncbi:MAG: hypothetical protein EOP34_11200, partial [Rickettsiales bacterium]
KILDPSAGMGNFPLIAYYKLMKGLKDVIRDKDRRRRHILENMLYMVELNPINANMIRGLLGGKTSFNKRGYNLNIVTADFIKGKLLIGDKDLGCIKYDLVMGNPPYNSHQKTVNKRGGGNSLWPYFVKKSILLIGDKGFLTFVHPSGWRKPESGKSKYKGLFRCMAYDCTPLYIEMHDLNDGIKTFNSSTRYDWYVIKRVKNMGYKTNIRDIQGKRLLLNLRRFSWLPNCKFHKIKSICDNNPQFDNSRIIYSRNAYGSDTKTSHKRSILSRVKTSHYKHTVIHSCVERGVIVMYSSLKNRGHFGISKVIFSDGSLKKPILDVGGKYGMTEHSMAIPIKSKRDGILLIKYLKSKYVIS